MGSPRRWRILWLIKGLGVGGAEQLLRAALPYLDRERFDYQIAYLLAWKDALVPAFREAGMPVHNLEMRHPLDFRVLPRLAALLRRERIDLIHAHLPVAGIVGRIAARRAGVGAVVYTEHNLPARYRWATRLGNRLTYGWNDTVIAVSEEVRRGVAGYARRPRLVTIPNAVTVDVMIPPRNAVTTVRDEFGIAPSAPLIVTVGNLTPKKGHVFLLAAASQVLSAEPSACFLVVGQGPLDRTLRREAQRLGLDGRVIFTGFRTDALRLMAAADIFVLSSLHEGLPVALLEAMALGKPVVATETGGIPEVATNATALLVPPGDPERLASALLNLLRDPEGRRKMGLAAREVMRQRHGTAQMVRAVESFYRKLLESGYSGGPEGQVLEVRLV